MFEVSFFQASRLIFFLPFGFCPPKVGPVVCVSFVQGEICAEFLFFVCFSSDGQMNELSILFAGDWVCIFVLFVVCLWSPEQGATGSWVLPGLVFKWFPLWKFSLFDTP